MVPRGELGLIIAGLALSRGVIAESVYVETVWMVILTSIIAPVILSKLYRITPTEVEEPKKPKISPIPPPPTPPEPEEQEVS